MANVKAGDLAYITHPSLLGRLVNVLHMAPRGRYGLPDGYPGVNDCAGVVWVCESLGSPFPAKVAGGRIRQARYAGIEDVWLRPIRGDGLGDTEPTSTTLPERAEV